MNRSLAILILLVGLTGSYFTMESITTRWFQHVKICLIEKVPGHEQGIEPNCEAVWDADGHLVLPWYVKVFKVVALRPVHF
jgi:hypothetical protein